MNIFVTKNDWIPLNLIALILLFLDFILWDCQSYSLVLNIIHDLLESRSIDTPYQWKLEIIKPLDSIIYLSTLPMVHFMHRESRDFISNKQYHIITLAADNFIRAFFSSYLQVI